MYPVYRAMVFRHCCELFKVEVAYATNCLRALLWYIDKRFVLHGSHLRRHRCDTQHGKRNQGPFQGRERECLDGQFR